MVGSSSQPRAALINPPQMPNEGFRLFGMIQQSTSQNLQVVFVYLFAQ